MKSNIALSVVVPVYNVAPFLARCLDSLLAQTYANFEVILVDDGSTDESGTICDAYASKFRHSKVIHQQNQGLSGARNAGISAAEGSYIGFIDSDDWVFPAMLETLYEAAQKSNADISEVAYIMSSDPQVNQPKQSPESESVKAVSGIEAAKLMLNEERYAVWNRLYAKHLFEGMHEAFPVGLTCEDRVFNLKVFPKAQTVAISNRVEYVYFQQLGSISRGGLDMRSFDLLKADKLMVSYAQKTEDEQLIKLAEDRAAKGAFSLLVKWARFGINSKEVDKESFNSLREKFLEDYSTLQASSLPVTKKLVAWQLRRTPALLRLEFKVHNILARNGG